MSISDELAGRMSGPKRALDARLGEAETAAKFVGTALSLRPRLGRAAIPWDSLSGEDRELTQRFLSARDVSADPLIPSLLVICYGAFEAYINEMIKRAADAVGATRTAIDKLPESLLVENVFRTGRAYLTAKAESAHKRFDFPALARALAACEPGNREFSLNAECFGYEIGVVSLENLRRALARLGVDLNWDSFGRDADIRRILGHDSTRRCAKAVETTVQDLVRDRNVISHTGYTHDTRDVDDICRYAQVLRRFCRILTDEVAAQMDANLSAAAKLA